MRRAIGIGLVCAWLGTGCTPPRDMPPPDITSESEPAPVAADVAPLPSIPQAEPFVATQAVEQIIPPPVPTGASNQVEETHAAFIAQTIPDNLMDRIIARFPFDTDEQSDPAYSRAIPVVFERAGDGYAEGALVPANKPRLVKGRFGNGLLLEDAHSNLLSRNQAAVEGSTTSSFIRLKSAEFAFTTNECWQGKQSLKVMTPGINGDEGVGIEVNVDKAFYDGQAIVPAHVIASVYLKGKGNLLLSLKEPGAVTETESAIVNLDLKTWRRFSCVYSATFDAIAIGPGHESDWKNFLPSDIPLNTKLLFACATTDRKKTTFYADGFQVEQRQVPFAIQGASASPRSWTPGGSTTTQDEFSFSTQGPAAAEWKKAGAISFWFKPDWDVRDGTQELLLYLGPATLHLKHLHAQIEFHPAGVALTPYDWKDTWHHIAVTWNEEGRRTLFVDGYDYVHPRGDVRPIPAGTDRLLLSAEGAGNSPNGIVDELILFRGELTLEQVKAIASYTPPAPKPRIE